MEPCKWRERSSVNVRLLSLAGRENRAVLGAFGR
jgi:hypothetical protein